MANTYLTDLAFVHETFKDYVDGEVAKQSNFLNSAAVVSANVLMPEYGSTVTLPSWDGFSGSADVKGSAAPATNAVSTSAQIAPILDRVKKYGSNDLVSAFTGSDPFGNLGAKFGKYWANQLDESLVSIALGAAGGVDALSAGSVVNDITGGTGSAAVISASAIIDTQALMGEHAADLQLMVVHPLVLAALRKQNLITTMQDYQSMKFFDYYGNLRIVSSSTAGLDAGSGVYNTLIVASGAFGYADGTNPRYVLETFRDIGYADTVASSKRYVMHPMGAKWTGTPAGATATNAELKTAGNWTLGLDSVELFKVRVLKSKIA